VALEEVATADDGEYCQDDVNFDRGVVETSVIESRRLAFPRRPDRQTCRNIESGGKLLGSERAPSEVGCIVIDHVEEKRD
jgi:hypothetical protein